MVFKLYIGFLPSLCHVLRSLLFLALISKIRGLLSNFLVSVGKGTLTSVKYKSMLF